ncbi:MAG: FAD-dependent oxidoreductase, partial [Arenicella sp.]|nr:FAD-dependent oxidoreductase [Arenicella sp.]
AQNGVVYNATSINKLFCQRKNLFSPRFYRMLFDLVRFYRLAPGVLRDNDHITSVATYLQRNNFSESFREDHLLPMISALWSATPERVEQFPIRHLVEFMHSHGMMKLLRRPAWQVIEGGSDNYVKALQAQISCDWHTNSEVSRIERNPEGAIVQTVIGDQRQYDAVVFATHADQVLKILAEPTSAELQILGNIKFEKNHVVVHTDENIMHPNKAAWASWNTEVPNRMDTNSLQCCTANYWMNSLQGLKLKTNVFATLNSHNKINPELVLAERFYHHPIFTEQSVASQRQLEQINGKHRTYFAGAYWGWGFHEDGARSAFRASQLVKQQV